MARIALYYPWIYLKSGVERTILEIYRRSRHDVIIVTSHYDRDATFEELAGCNIVQRGQVSVKRTYLQAAKAALTMANLRFDRAGYDALVICCDGLGPLLTFRNRNLPLMNLCFTPLRAVYDMDYRDRLLARNGPRTAKLVAEKLFRLLDRAAWRKFDSVICNSRTTRARAVDGGLRAKGEMIVAYPGIAAAAIRPAGQVGDYFFLPGRIMWTKNIELAIDAYRDYRAQGGTLGLVIAGMVDRKSGPYYESLQAQAADLDGIRFETEVSDARMQALYGGCRAVLLAAFNEDQGLTPLEGMAVGKPTIAIDRGGPRESVIHGQTGFLVEPQPQPFAEAMLRLDQNPDLARAMGLRGQDRVSLFTWENFIAVFDDEIDRIVAQKAQIRSPQRETAAESVRAEQ
ncbi:glycosyltransferase [Pseudotabrizicola alkalilacus]|uniref:Glycosyltransferase n=1 Tax=Pseudotabrizicola alkalilacus TaxID=2305252 RepID=A0A411YZX8_9RHOB|nr:glycosyltransferase [Pseudotabrizicola alkalilacus]RGP36348.1 glycosyltransferase [Pseudotabrizicola alkalilacus]